MKESLFISGILLIEAGMIFAVLTLGVGAICTGPMVLIGIILMIIGLIFPAEVKTMQFPPSSPPRFCTDCGRSIPFDARFCPYCDKNFEQN